MAKRGPKIQDCIDTETAKIRKLRRDATAKSRAKMKEQKKEKQLEIELNQPPTTRSKSRRSTGTTSGGENERKKAKKVDIEWVGFSGLKNKPECFLHENLEELKSNVNETFFWSKYIDEKKTTTLSTKPGKHNQICLLRAKIKRKYYCRKCAL